MVDEKSTYISLFFFELFDGVSKSQHALMLFGTYRVRYLVYGCSQEGIDLEAIR